MKKTNKISIILLSICFVISNHLNLISTTNTTNTTITNSSTFTIIYRGQDISEKARISIWSDWENIGIERNSILYNMTAKYISINLSSFEAIFIKITYNNDTMIVNELYGIGIIEGVFHYSLEVGYW